MLHVCENKTDLIICWNLVFSPPLIYHDGCHRRLSIVIIYLPPVPVWLVMKSQHGLTLLLFYFFACLCLKRYGKIDHDVLYVYFNTNVLTYFSSFFTVLGFICNNRCWMSSKCVNANKCRRL